MKITSITIHASIDGKKELHEVRINKSQIDAVIEFICALGDGAVRIREKPSSIIDLSLEEVERLKSENDNLKMKLRQIDELLESGGHILCR